MNVRDTCGGRWRNSAGRATGDISRLLAKRGTQKLITVTNNNKKKKEAHSGRFINELSVDEHPRPFVFIDAALGAGWWWGGASRPVAVLAG